MSKSIEMRLQRIEESVEKLLLINLKDKVDQAWLDEDTASGMFGIGSRHFRRKVVSREFPFDEVQYRNTNGRNYQYNRKDLLKAKEKSSVNGKPIRMAAQNQAHKATA